MVSGLTRRRLLGALPAALLPALPARAQERPFTVVALGQAVVTRDLREPPYPGFARLAELLHGANACAVDLVAAIRGPNAGPPAREAGLLADPAALDGLKALGIGLLAVANSHAYDLEAGGLAGLVDAARARDLTFAGAGANLAAANAAGYRRTPDAKVALVAFATGDVRANSAAGESRPGINVIPRQASGELEPLEIERVTSQVHAAAENADIAIVYHHHAAGERDARPRPDWLQRVARRAIASGASMVVGAGLPHLAGIEIHRGRPIFYGLGNVALQAPGEAEPERLQSIAARCSFAGGALRQIELLPIQLSAARPDEGAAGTDATRGRPSPADPEQAQAILARVAELSRPYDTTIEIADGVGRVAL